MSSLDFTWLPSRSRAYFSLAPLELVGPPADLSRPGSLGRVLVSAWAGEGRVRRLGRVTDETARREALALAEETRDPVVVAEVAALVGPDGEPVYRSLGRVTMAKADDPLSPEAWRETVSRLSGRLRVIANQEMEHLVQESLQWIAAEFYEDSGRTAASAAAGIRGTLRSPRGTMIRAQRVAITNTLSEVMRRTTGAMARLPEIAPTLGTAFNLPDRRIAQTMARHHGFWVRDWIGTISMPMARRAQPIIQRGIMLGLGRREIGRELREAIHGSYERRMKGYWDVVAANHITRARSYATGYTMRAAGIEYYKIEAILDEATTETCLMLHDKILPVGPAMARQEAILASPDPEAVRWNNPFVVDKDGELAAVTPDGHREVLARIDERGRGTGIPGTYSNVMSQREMVSAAIGFPPYHHNCRTTLISEVF